MAIAIATLQNIISTQAVDHLRCAMWIFLLLQTQKWHIHIVHIYASQVTVFAV